MGMAVLSVNGESQLMAPGVTKQRSVPCIGRCRRHHGIRMTDVQKAGFWTGEKALQVGQPETAGLLCRKQVCLPEAALLAQDPACAWNDR